MLPREPIQVFHWQEGTQQKATLRKRCALGATVVALQEEQENPKKTK